MKTADYAKRILVRLKSKGFIVSSDEVTESQPFASMVILAFKMLSKLAGIHAPSYATGVNLSTVSSALEQLNCLSEFSALRVNFDIVTVVVIVEFNKIRNKISELKAVLFAVGKICREVGVREKMTDKNSGSFLRPIVLVESTDSIEIAKDIIFSELQDSKLLSGLTIKPCVIDMQSGRIHWKQANGLLGKLQAFGQQHEAFTQEDLDAIS